MRSDLKKELAAAALAAFTLTVPTDLTAEAKVPTPNEVKQHPDDGLERTRDIKDLNKKAGRYLTKHIYDWQDVVKKYNLNPADFENGAKLSKEQELNCAATLQAISIYEASRPNAIEEAYYYEDLAKNWPEGEVNKKIKDALENASSKSFSEILAEETAHLKNDKKSQKNALTELDEFRASPDKGYSLTEKVDGIIINSQTTNKTMSAAMFMSLAAKNRG